MLGTGSGARAYERAGRGSRLSRRRPLPWRLWLPALTGGVLAGALSSLAWGPAALWVSAAWMCLVPLGLLAHRGLGTFGVLAATSALLVSLRTLAGIPDGGFRGAGGASVDGVYRGQVRSVKTGSWGAQARWAALELEVLVADERAPAGPRPGEGLRLSIGRTRGGWEIGEGIEVAVSPRPARGFCNLGVDRWARTLARRGIQWSARVRKDDQVARIPPDAFGRQNLWSLVHRVRGRIGRAIDRSLDGESAGVLRALVIGDRSSISAPLREVFARTGTSHLLAVSGMHLGLVAATVYALVGYLWSLLGARSASLLLSSAAGPCALVAAAAYAAVAGGAVSASRALAMALLGIVGLMLRRNWSASGSLMGAVILLLVVDPEGLYDISLQLSVVSVAAILLLLDRLRDTGLSAWLAHARERGAGLRAAAWALAAGLVSLAAGCATMPLGAHYFGMVSLVGVPTNLVLGPLLGIGSLIPGLLGAVVSLVPGHMERPFFAVAGLMIDLALRMARFVAAWPAAGLDVEVADGGRALALVLAGAGLLLGRGWGRGASWLAAAALALAPVFLQVGARELRLGLLDVGQGDAMVLETVEGRTWVIDGGGLAGDFDTGERIVLPAVDRAVGAHPTAVVLSHADRDHYGGLTTLVGSRAVSSFWWNGRASSGKSFKELLQTLERRGVPRYRAFAGRALPGDGVTEIRVVSPVGSPTATSSNDASVVLGVRYGATHLLLAGDIEAAGENALLKSGSALASTVLKVPHHGSRSSSTPDFLEEVRPALALASLGDRNRFGFPAPAVVDAYLAVGARWLSTDRAGEITLSSDGQVERVETCRGLRGAV